MRPVEERGAWDELLGALPERGPGPGGGALVPHLLQSWDWGELKGRWGWRVERFAWGAPGGEWAAAQITSRRVGGLPLRIGYAPKGPLVAGGEERWRRVLADLERWSRRRGLALLKIDADVPADAEALARQREARGWQRSPEQIQFPDTMRSEIAADDDAQLAAMRSKTRYNVRLAERRGVRVRRGGAELLADFHALYVETGRRQGFGLRAEAYYRDAWTSLLQAGRATVILAEHEGRPLAGVLPARFGDTAWYLYGASASEGREHMAAYAAQHESLRWAREVGCRHYDWWGGPARLERDDPLYGVYRFKRGFGAVWAPQLGAWDFPARRVRHGLYRSAARARAAWLARLAGERAFG